MLVFQCLCDTYMLTDHSEMLWCRDIIIPTCQASFGSVRTIIGINNYFTYTILFYIKILITVGLLTKHTQLVIFVQLESWDRGVYQADTYLK